MYIYIRSMSESQTEVYRRVSDQAVNILEHLIKVIEYPDAQEVNHWKQEIYAFLNDVKKLRGTNKLPKSKLIFKGLSVSNDMIDKFIGRVHRTNKGLRSRNLDTSVILKCVEEYQHWLADSLSKEGLVDPDDVYSKIDEIINRGGNS